MAAWLFEGANGEGEPEVNKKIVRRKDIAFSRNAKIPGESHRGQGRQHEGWDGRGRDGAT